MGPPYPPPTEPGREGAAAPGACGGTGGPVGQNAVNRRPRSSGEAGLGARAGAARGNRSLRGGDTETRGDPASEGPRLSPGVSVPPPPAAPRHLPAVGPPRGPGSAAQPPAGGEEGWGGVRASSPGQSGSGPVGRWRGIFQPSPRGHRPNPPRPQPGTIYTAPAPPPPRPLPRVGGGHDSAAPRSGAVGGRCGGPVPLHPHRTAPLRTPPPATPQTTDGRAVPAPPGVRPFPGCPRLTHILRPRPRRFPAPPPTARGGRPSPFRPQSRAPGGWGRLLSTAGAPPTTPPEPPPPHVGGSRVGITQPRGARCGDRSPVPRRDPHANNEMPPPDRRSRLSIKPAWGERGGRAAAER